MEVTRRYWTTCALAVLLALWSLILERTVLLIGSALILGWLLARQYHFVRNVIATNNSISVSQAIDRDRISENESVLCSVDVQLHVDISGSVTVTTQAPLSDTNPSQTCRVSKANPTAETAFTLSWPVAGSFTLPPPTVTLVDSLGLFKQDFESGPELSVTVVPRVPRDMHIGQGGETLAVGFGEHDAGTTGSGLTPAEVRKYVAGDSAQQIDWKATARLREPHVREFEAETDLQTQLIFDHRSSMRTGIAGETKLDFARHLALALVENAQQLTDPLGMYTIGDAGFTHVTAPQTEAEHYDRLADTLRDISPTEPVSESHGDTQLSPAQARRRADQLDGSSQFAQRLRPFFAATDIYVQQVATKPLFKAARTIATGSDGTRRTFIITDDMNRVELREAVKISQKGGGQVVVFIAPTSLFDRATLSDAGEAYQQYVEFESFRSELSSIEWVDAFEFGPGDRLNTVLGSEQSTGGQ